MDITTKTVTTRTHTAVAKTDEFKDVAILAVKRKLGLSDSAIVSTDATVGEDGSISVEVVEAVKVDDHDDDDKVEDVADDAADTSKRVPPNDPSAPKSPAVPAAIPMGIVGA